jgi:hypothetical protein
VIRRGFWLAAGAVAGIAGYRRATRLARELTGRRAASERAAVRQAPGRAQTATARISSAAGFVRDVRDGMTEYRDLHVARTLGSPRTLGKQSDSAAADGQRAGRSA